jgi:hypothetical protein
VVAVGCNARALGGQGESWWCTKGAGLRPPATAWRSSRQRSCNWRWAASASASLAATLAFSAVISSEASFRTSVSMVTYCFSSSLWAKMATVAGEAGITPKGK